MKVLSAIALLFASTTLANASLFNLSGATVSGTLQLNGGTYSSGPFTIADDDGAILDFNLKFDQGANAPSFVMSFEDAGSPFLFSDRQGVLNIVTFIDTPFTLQAGFNLTITGLFAAPGSPDAIGDFQFVDGYDAGLLLGTLSTSYNAQTGTLVITSSEDIELPDGINLTAQGRFSVIPEPASISIFAGLVAVAALTRRCRQRR